MAAFNDVQPAALDRRTCLAQLRSLQDKFACPVCHALARAPVLFPCGEHVACFDCVVNLLNHACRTSLELDAQHHPHTFRQGAARCPCCNTAATAFTEASMLAQLRCPPSALLDVVYGSTPHACPHCAYSGTMAQLSHHLLSPDGLAHVVCHCPDCAQPYKLDAVDAHLRTACHRIPCLCTNGHDAACPFRGTAAQLKQHLQAHAAIRDVLTSLQEVRDDLAELRARTFLHPPGGATLKPFGPELRRVAYELATLGTQLPALLLDHVG